ncbi:unnamed protein product [Coregonus sp. 'balchen']|nr:unnamed protein product [Coregonus sp. 'balchen']
MEILRPSLINISGRIYRRNTIKEDQYEEAEEEDSSYVGPPASEQFEEEQEFCDSHAIEQTDKVITGSQKAAVSSAVTRVELLVESFRRKQPFTHFLSFALNHPQVQDGFLRFKEEVLEQTITEGKPLPLEVTGIEYMNDDPAMVDVLYAKVHAIVERLVDHFVSSGLMVREWDRVKLHGTVMNTLFRKVASAEATGGRQNMKEREAFDARNILKFGEFDLNAVQISQRYSTDCTGFYTPAGVLNFS